MSDTRLECRGLQGHEKAAYLEFAAKAWGVHSPEADPSFLDWLYANPNTLGIGQDLIVLAEEGRIVGAHHRMRVPWRVNNKRSLIPSLHDLYVLPSHRHMSNGHGLMPPSLQLMLAAFDAEPQVALFGLSPQAESIYKGLRMPELQLFWLRRIRAPLRAGVQIAASRLGWQLRSRAQPTKTEEMWCDHQVLRIPFPTSDELLEALTLKPDEQCYPDWDLESYRWRFFHELGPRNFLLLARRNGRIKGRSVVSIGLSRSCIVARIAELLFEDSAAMEALLWESEGVFSSVGASVCLAVTSSGEAAKRLTSSGWSLRRKPAGSRWFSRHKSDRPERLWISGGAWDYGCDAHIRG